MSIVSNVGGQLDLRLRQGADFATTATFQNSDGTPVDLTGCTLAAEIRSGPNLSQLFATFVVAIVTPASAGVATLTLPAAQSALLPAMPEWGDDEASYWWDLELTDTAGHISSPLYGKVFVLREITQ